MDEDPVFRSYCNYQLHAATYTIWVDLVFPATLCEGFCFFLGCFLRATHILCMWLWVKACQPTFALGL